MHISCLFLISIPHLHIFACVYVHALCIYWPSCIKLQTYCFISCCCAPSRRRANTTQSRRVACAALRKVSRSQFAHSQPARMPIRVEESKHVEAHRSNYARKVAPTTTLHHLLTPNRRKCQPEKV